MSTLHSKIPVGELFRPVDPLTPETSLENAATYMHEHAVSALPVVSTQGLLGLLTEADLREALKTSEPHTAPIQKVLWRTPNIVSASHTCEYAQNVLTHSDESTLVVVDEIGQVLGVISGSDILAKAQKEIRPRMIGGMATPFGVYLTTGAVNAGAKPIHLIILGACIFTGFITSTLLSFWITNTLYVPVFGQTYIESIFSFFTILLFLVGLRLSPLSGIHGAEHKVVHAIEREERLVPEIVARMPRIHPRCGTNLAAGVALFLGLFQSGWFKDPQINLLASGMLTLFWWRPLGSLLQFLFTTKEPSPVQLERGIEVGKELLQRYQAAPVLMPSIWMRIWNSGLPPIIVGSMGAYFIIDFIFAQFGLPRLY
jgi:CBS domain-containing protein